MVAGLIQLGAYGREQVYLTYQPEITFFKIRYKRHTFFTLEAIEQNFMTRPDFGTRHTSILSAHGDLITDATLVVNLPPITPIPNVEFRWVEAVAAALIKKVEIEINGVVIDTIPGEWIRIEQELMGSRKRSTSQGSHQRGLSKMMGMLEPFTDSIQGIPLFVPLPFWFTRSVGQALPIASINTHEVRVNIDFNPIDKVLQYGPTHSMQIAESRVFFRHGALLRQGSGVEGIFFRFDPNTKTIYFNPVRGSFSAVAQTDLYSPATLVTDGNTFCTPKTAPFDLGLAKTLPYTLRQRFHIGSGTTLLTQYVFLGSQEKQFFTRTRHDYIIDQIQYAASVTKLQKRQMIRLMVRHPCKELVWIAKNSNDEISSILARSTLLMNSLEIWSDDTDGRLQMQMHHEPALGRRPGIHTYSFALHPDQAQPSGSVNMSHIERIYLDLALREEVKGDVAVNVYARTYNVLAIEKGVGRLLF